VAIAGETSLTDHLEASLAGSALAQRAPSDVRPAITIVAMRDTSTLAERPTRVEISPWC
jgi:hypothetical protein